MTDIELALAGFAVVAGLLLTAASLLSWWIEKRK